MFFNLRCVLFFFLGNYPALLRNCLDIPVSSNVCEFLTELGAKVKFFVFMEIIILHFIVSDTLFPPETSPKGITMAEDILPLSI